jgi:hypothetical protein
MLARHPEQQPAARSFQWRRAARHRFGNLASEIFP